MTPYLFLLGRLLFGAYFIANGIKHFRMLGAITEAAASAGMPMPHVAAIASGALMILGGLSVMLGLLPRIGCLFLLAFLLPAAFMVHAFWRIDDPAQHALQLSLFLRNLALAGASLALMGAPSPWPLSLSSGRMRRPTGLTGRRLVERHA